MSTHSVRRPANKAPKRHQAHFSRHRWLLATLGLLIIVGGLYYHYDNRLPSPLAPPPADALYKQANQPISKRVEDLLARMTLEEKIGQMVMVDKSSIKKPVDISRYNFGAVLSGAGAKPSENTAAGWLDMVEAIKAEAKRSRLGIPLLYGVDATHGHANVPGATVFPHAIGLGASGNSELVKEVGNATAEEVAATGINWNFAPSLDAPEDTRWGRTYETFSSEPRLNARLGTAFISGTQAFVSAEDSSQVLATAKHFLGAGSMQWLSSNNKNFKIDQGVTPAQVNRLDSHIEPFAAAVKADVSSVMIGLNNWGDERVIDNKFLITDKLKTKLGFKGIVVSDWYGVYEFAGTNKYRANIKAINAGVDMAMLPFEYKTFIRDMRNAVRRGDIPGERIDDAVRRILYQKFKAGLFDTKSSSHDLTTLGSAKHRRLARRAVAASAVLLKNKDQLVPINKQTKRILVAGSGTDNVGRQSGAWTVEWQGIDGNWLPGSTSILEGIRKSSSPSTVVDFREDADFKTSDKKADVGIAVVSEKPYAEGWGDNANPTIDASDKLVIERLKQASKNVIVVIVSGRPLFMREQIDQADSVVAVWLPGSEGEGVADVLFGAQPFTAKLPLAWPSHVSQLPITIDGKTADGTKPLFSRGFGLTK